MNVNVGLMAGIGGGEMHCEIIVSSHGFQSVSEDMALLEFSFADGIGLVGDIARVLSKLDVNIVRK
ncbi:MAG: hypothetical protein AAGG50_12530 [Bacteroidota bacterium]